MPKSDDLKRARLLVEMARVAEQQEETAKALGLYDDALAEFSADSLDPFLPDVLRWKGTLLRERGETDAAFRCYTQSLEKAVAIGMRPTQRHEERLRHHLTRIRRQTPYGTTCGASQHARLAAIEEVH